MRKKHFFITSIYFVCIIFFSLNDYLRGQDWVRTIGPGLLGGPSVADDGTVYVAQTSSPAGGSSNIYAYSPDGTLQWQYHPAHRLESGPAIADNGTVYVNIGAELIALNPDGSLYWSVEAPQYFLGEPAIAKDGTVYIGAYDPNLYAYNPDGSLRSVYNLPNGGHPKNPVIGRDGTVYFTTDMTPPNFPPDFNYLYAIRQDGDSLNLKWFYVIGQIINEPVIGFDGTIYVLFRVDSHLHAFDPDGSRKWDLRLTTSPSWGAPALGPGGVIYVASGPKIYAINNVGQIIWEYRDYGFSGQIASTPAIGNDGRIHYGTRTGYFYILLPDGSQDWWWPVGESIHMYSAVAITNDGHFVLNTSTRLFHMSTSSNGPAMTSWAMYRANAKRNGRVNFFEFNYEALKYLMSKLVEFVQNSQLYNSFYVKLESALKSYNKGQIKAAKNKIKAFINEVEAQRGKKIPEENARTLIYLAMMVIG